MKFLYLFLGLLLVSCSDNSQTIKIKGSDTEVNLCVLMAEEFHEHNPEILISISGGGSGLGIASLMNGNADIANSSRKIEEEELELFKKRDIQLDTFAFAQDAVAFVISDKLSIDSISISDLAKVLSGEEPNWEFLSDNELAINIYGRQSNSGTHHFVSDKLNIEFSPSAKQMNGNAQILESLKSDKSGIGYVGAGYVKDENIKGLKVLKIYQDGEAAISPLDAEKIEKNKYYFQRSLYQYYKSDDYEKVKPFLDFQISEKGKEIILNTGYYPI